MLTQHGRGVAVLVDIREFEFMQERLETLEDIAVARAQLDADGGIPHEVAKARVLDRRVLEHDLRLHQISRRAIFRLRAPLAPPLRKGTRARHTHGTKRTRIRAG